MNAMMLSISFVEKGSTMDNECLTYRGRAISSLRQVMDSHTHITSEATIGAILFLAVVEVCIYLFPPPILALLVRSVLVVYLMDQDTMHLLFQRD